MFRYPTIENHHNSKYISYWVNMKPELKSIKMVATQKYDGSNISIEFTADNKINYYTRNTQISESENFCGLKEILKQDKYASMLNKIKIWKQAHPEVETINLFGEFYGPGIQKRIDYGPEKQIKFFDVYFNKVMQSPLKMKQWFEDIKLEDLLVETLLTGTFDELVNSLEKCQELVNHKIEGIVIKPYEEIIRNVYGHSFCIKVKDSEFSDIFKQMSVKPKHNKETRISLKKNLSSYITENRIQDCKGKESWTKVGDLINHVISDAFNDYRKDSSFTVENLTSTERKKLSKKTLALCQKLYNLDTGELL